MKSTVSVVICAYNEENTLGKVLEKVRALNFVTEIVAIDNGSSDQTGAIISKAAALDPRVRLVTVEKNQGLGFGLRAGISQTTGAIVVRQDADLEYDPQELIYLVEQIDGNNADVVYGSRTLVRKAHQVHYYYNYLANTLITHFSNFFTNLYLTDVETAAKAFKGKLIRSLHLKSNGFEIENEITVKLAQLGCTFYEVPISYYGRKYSEGKKIRWHDGFKALFYTFTYFLAERWDKKLKALRDNPTLRQLSSE